MLTTVEWCNPASNMLHHILLCRDRITVNYWYYRLTEIPFNDFEIGFNSRDHRILVRFWSGMYPGIFYITFSVVEAYKEKISLRSQKFY